MYVIILTIFITCITFETVNLYVVLRKKIWVVPLELL